MKKRIKAGIAAVLLMTTLLLSGCQIGGRTIEVTSVLSNRYVFKIDTVSCSTSEAKLYLANFQNIYGTAYGINLWEHNFGNDSLVNYVKDAAMAELTRVVCMDLLAESLEMTLTAEDLDKVSEAANEYYSSLNKEEISYIGASENEIRIYYEHYALAQKLYHSLTDGVNAEVSEDEARVIEIMQIFTTSEAKAEEIESKLAAGEDFATLASNYNELGTIQITVARDTLPKEVEDVAFNLNNDEISNEIQTENGFYFVKCLNKYNQELTEANKSNIVAKREKEAFDDVYNEFISGLSSDLNSGVWEKITLDTTSDIQTNSFFSTYEKYCGDL